MPTGTPESSPASPPPSEANKTLSKTLVEMVTSLLVYMCWKLASYILLARNPCYARDFFLII
jgi:hypothetical protein